MSTLRWVVVALTAAATGFGAAWWLFGLDGDSAEGVDASGEREVRYWVAPMDPDYRREEPGKSPMGMDLVPVYADQEDDAAAVPSIRIAAAVINNIGVKTGTAKRADLPRRIETVATIEPNEHRLGHVHVRTEGWIETLNVHAEGARVERGEVLFSFYAPALVSAQREYLQALQQNRRALVDAAAGRLTALGLQPQQIERLATSQEVQRLVDIKAPHGGYVMRLNVRHGMFVTPSLMIMSIADLASVWVEIDVFERQAGWLAPGQLARMTVAAAPGRVWQGELDYVYPTIRPESRTARARIVFDNPALVLKPGMYAEIQIDAAPVADVVTVPSQAVIRTGRQERVVLALGEGRFRAAEVRTGLESRGRTEIIEGLTAGERIVVSGQFLIDSEASMEASLLRMIGEAPSQILPREQKREKDQMDHSVHDMEDAPTPALPREQGREKKQMNHSDHDMEPGARAPALSRERGREKDQIDHYGHDMEDAPSRTLPRKQRRDQSGGAKIESATSSSSLPSEQEKDESHRAHSLPRSRGRAGVGAHSGGDKQ